MKFWNGMEWNTENLEYYSSFWSILLSSIRVFRKSRYSENIQEYREKLYSSSIRVTTALRLQSLQEIDLEFQHTNRLQQITNVLLSRPSRIA